MAWEAFVQTYGVVEFIKETIECSILISPRDCGLTHAEIQEAAKRAGFRPGETNDAIGRSCRRDGDRCMFNQDFLFMHGGVSVDFNERYEPDYRKWEAFEFVRQELFELEREVTEARATLPRDTLVARCVAKGQDRRALEVAITVNLLAGVFKEAGGGISHANRMWALPSAQIPSRGRYPVRSRPHMADTHAIIKDIIDRRADGRPQNTEPLDVFEHLLRDLGHERFRAWWVQQRNELRLAGPMQPV